MNKLKTALKLIGFYGMYVVAFTLAVVSVYWRIQNVDMSETRLLVLHWVEYCVGFAVFIVFLLMSMISVEADQSGDRWM